MGGKNSSACAKDQTLQLRARYPSSKEIVHWLSLKNVFIELKL
jgi:hypothetical protein